MKQKTVWVIEQGSYSDYGVVGVFSSRENAELVAAAINSDEFHGDDATVDEWSLDPAVDDIAHGRTQFHIVMLRDGTVERCKASDISGYELGGSVSIWRRTQAPAYIGKGIPDAMQATVWATDTKHAIKIANEKRTQLIASGEWT